jgi:hypothetical protein
MIFTARISGGSSTAETHKAGTGFGEQAQGPDPVAIARPSEELSVAKIAPRVFKVRVTLGFHCDKTIQEVADPCAGAAGALADAIQIEPDELRPHLLAKILCVRAGEGEGQ